MTPNPKHERTHYQTSSAGDDGEHDQKSLQSYIPPYLRQYVRPYHGDFCYTPIFHPTLIAQLMMEGFLPIACADFVLPKLHSQRCVIQPLTDLHVSKQVRKRAKRYSLTINQSFDEVVASCRHQHGDHCWLYPTLVTAFKSLHTATATGDGSGYPTTTQQGEAISVRLYTIELWNVETNTLAAGELGYAVGSIFTSLTGFTKEDSAGSIQLAALGRLLAQHSFTVWDLGMDMDYKRALGSRLVPRDDFVRTVRASRSHAATLSGSATAARRACRDIVDGGASNPTTATTQQRQPPRLAAPPGF